MMAATTSRVAWTNRAIVRQQCASLSRVDQRAHYFTGYFSKPTSCIGRTTAASLTRREQAVVSLRMMTTTQHTRYTLAPAQARLHELGVTNGSIRTINRSVPHRRRRQRSATRRVDNNAPGLVPVSSLHVGQTIDLYAVIHKVFMNNVVKKKLFGKNSVVVQLAPVTQYDEIPRYVAVFRFGSVVSLNVSHKEAAAFVRDIKDYTVDPVLAGVERKEVFGVLVKEPTIVQEETGETEPIVTGDYCIVPELDMNGFAIISNILAQTTALDSYNDTVDELLSRFASINASVTKTGSFSATDKDFFFKTVAQNNLIFIDMVSKLRLKDRSETAWDLTKYERLHYSLNDEFEISDRFEQIEFKLNLIQQNAKFFLEILQHKKSNSLEWIIVILILAECCLMCVEMSGAGDVMFAKIAGIITGGHYYDSRALTAVAANIEAESNGTP